MLNIFELVIGLDRQSQIKDNNYSYCYLLMFVYADGIINKLLKNEHYFTLLDIT